MLTFIVIDVIIILCWLLRELKTKNINKILNIVMLVIFFSMSGLAYKIHNDYFIYELLYPSINFKNYNLIYQFEVGYKLLNAVFNRILSFYQFKALVYFVNIILIYKGLKKLTSKSEVFYLLAFLYLDIHFFLIYLSAFRQSISISIFIYSLQFIKKRKFLKYIFIISIACMFHKSAIVLFLVYPVIRIIKINKKCLIFIGIIYVINKFIPIIAFLSLSIFNIMRIYIPILNRVDKYFQPNLSFKTSTISVLLVILFLVNIKNILKMKKYMFHVKCFIGYLIFTMFGSIFPIFYRVEAYIILFMILGIQVVVKSFGNINIRKILEISILLFFIIVYNIKAISIKHQENGSLIPFHFSIEVLYKNIPYESTSEYNHIMNRYNKEKINNLKQRIKNNEEL